MARKPKFEVRTEVKPGHLTVFFKNQSEKASLTRSVVVRSSSYRIPKKLTLQPGQEESIVCDDMMLGQVVVEVKNPNTQSYEIIEEVDVPVFDVSEIEEMNSNFFQFTVFNYGRICYGPDAVIYLGGIPFQTNIRGLIRKLEPFTVTFARPIDNRDSVSFWIGNKLIKTLKMPS